MSCQRETQNKAIHCHSRLSEMMNQAANEATDKTHTDTLVRLKGNPSVPDSLVGRHINAITTITTTTK